TTRFAAASTKPPTAVPGEPPSAAESPAGHSTAATPPATTSPARWPNDTSASRNPTSSIVGIMGPTLPTFARDGAARGRSGREHAAGDDRGEPVHRAHHQDDTTGDP